MRSLLAITAAFLCIFLTACGGGGDGGSSDENAAGTTIGANGAPTGPGGSVDNTSDSTTDNSTGADNSNTGTSTGTDSGTGNVPVSSGGSESGTGTEQSQYPDIQFNEPQSIAIDSKGTAYVGAYFTLTRIEPNGQAATIIPFSRQIMLNSLAVVNDILYAIHNGREIVRIDQNGNITSVAGSTAPLSDGAPTLVDGTGANAVFFCANAIAAGNDKNLYVSESCNNAIRRVTPAGEVSTVYRWDGLDHSDDQMIAPAAVAVDSAGRVYAGGRGYIWRIENGVPVVFAQGSSTATPEADLPGIGGMAFDNADNLYVTTSHYQPVSPGRGSATGDGTGAVRKITPQGVISTLAGNDSVTTVIGADGVGSNARFTLPKQIALHPDGSLYLVDQVDNTLRRLTTDGVATTYAGE